MIIRVIRRYGLFLLGVVFVICIAVFIPGNAQPQVYAQAQVTPSAVSSTSTRTISVSGTGSVQVAPDMASVTIGVQTNAKTATQALTQNNTQMQAVIDTLQKAGVTSTDIKTTSIQLTPQYTNPPQPGQAQAQATPTNQISGYIATNIVQVNVRKLDSLGSILDQVVAAGSNQIQGINFDLSNPALALDQAREASMKDATHKAQQLAGLANQTLGPVLTINENSQVPIPFAAAQAQSPGGNVPISPGTQSITVNLQVTWELEQK